HLLRLLHHFLDVHGDQIISGSGVPGFRGSGFRGSEVPEFRSSNLGTPEPRNLEPRNLGTSEPRNLVVPFANQFLPRPRCHRQIHPAPLAPSVPLSLSLADPLVACRPMTSPTEPAALLSRRRRSCGRSRRAPAARSTRASPRAASAASCAPAQT